MSQFPLTKSPFPGVDPYIEQCGLWEDFHSHLIEKIYEFLADNVPENYVVRTGERNYVVLSENGDEKKHVFKADVSIVSESVEPASENRATAVAEPETESESTPLSLRALIDEEFRESFIEIREADGEGRLVTCIEVLSPSNKKASSPGWDQYQRKRQGLFMERTASLIEIDLLRRGQRMPMVDPFPDSPYLLLVARRTDMPYCKVWRGQFRRRLPVIPVPLFKPDPDVQLDLQPLIDGIYARARYHRSIDYSRPLTPALTAEETAWFDMQKRSGGN